VAVYILLELGFVDACEVRLLNKLAASLVVVPRFETHDAAAQPVPTADRLVGQLRQQIMEGTLKPGMALRETALATTFGVSRNTLRDALRGLAYEGLVVRRMHSGTVVKTLTAADVRDLYAVRRALELKAVEESAMASEQRLAEVDAAVAAAEHAVGEGDWRSAGTASLMFHQALVAMLDSRLIDDFFRTVLAQVRLAFAEIRDEAGFQAPWIRQDRQICDFVLSGHRDQAGTALRRYLDESARIVIDVVRAQQSARRVSRPRHRSS
jgi:DNA-binding GntR family transcriptional regulator